MADDLPILAGPQFEIPGIYPSLGPSSQGLGGINNYPRWSVAPPQAPPQTYYPSQPGGSVYTGNPGFPPGLPPQQPSNTIDPSSRDANHVYVGQGQAPPQQQQQQKKPAEQNPNINQDPLAGTPNNTLTQGFRMGYGVGNPWGGAAAGAGLNLLFQYINKKYGTGKYNNTFFTGDQSHSMGDLQAPAYTGTREGDNGDLVLTSGDE